MTKQQIYRQYRFLENDLKTLLVRRVYGKELDEIKTHMHTQLNRLADLYNDGRWGDEKR